MAMQDLKELFLDELKDVFDAEYRISEALPVMIRKANAPKLKAALKHHLQQTEQHLVRLEEVFEEAGEKASRKTCKAMVGLLAEAESLMQMDGAESVKDAAIIAAGQKVEHYEMATYGCLRNWAQLLDFDESARTLQQTLDEEGQADKRLTELAKQLNREAVEGCDEEAELVGAGGRRMKSPGSKAAGRTGNAAGTSAKSSAAPVRGAGGIRKAGRAGATGARQGGKSLRKH